MITENLSTLTIHRLSKEQYERELTAGRIEANALYLTPDDEIDVEAEIDILNSDLLSHTNNKTIHVTSEDKKYWSNKVDKVEGKGLSTNDFTDDYKNTLDSLGEITFTETDPTVPAWAKEDTKPTYTAREVGALSDTTVLADLTTDAEHRTVTDTEKQNWNSKSNFSGDYNDLNNKPNIEEIESKLEELESLVDSGGGSGADINSGPILPETANEGDVFLKTSMAGQEYTETITISTTGTYSLTYPIASIVSTDYGNDQYPQFSIRDGLLVIDGDWYYSDNLTITYVIGEAEEEYPKRVSCTIYSMSTDISNALVKGVDNGSMITLYLDYSLVGSQDEESFTFGSEYADKILLGVYCLTPSGITVDSSLSEITPGQPLSQGFYFYQSPTRISESKAVVIIYYV